jgi:hypothetical protein
MVPEKFDKIMPYSMAGKEIADLSFLNGRREGHFTSVKHRFLTIVILLLKIAI